MLQLLLVFQQLTSCVAAAVIFAAAISDCSLGVATVMMYVQVITTVVTPNEEVVAETQEVSC